MSGYSNRNNRFEIQLAADYYPYGKTLRYFETAAFEEKFLTTQHERDRETGFDYRGARYYDSDLGRFLSLDPLAAKFPAWSAYNYVLGNPVKFTDPDGKEPEDIIIRNVKGGEIARILINTGKYDVEFSTPLTYSPQTPHVYDAKDLADLELKDDFRIDAIGLNIEASATLGGGMETGASLVFFLNGEDQYNLGVYSYVGGNVGYGGGVGGDFFVSNFNDEANQELFNANGFAGAYNAWGINAAGLGASVTWSNEKNTHDEVYPNHRNTRTWLSESAGSGWSPAKLGKFNAKFSGGDSVLKNLIFPKLVQKNE